MQRIAVSTVYTFKTAEHHEPSNTRKNNRIIKPRQTKQNHKSAEPNLYQRVSFREKGPKTTKQSNSQNIRITSPKGWPVNEGQKQNMFIWVQRKGIMNNAQFMLA
ncbi:hypothetical protein BJY01DRAFT_1738 [Aspergillus pseudoustus]|uniref:Uncharacterized protein n=1 Tax=Aspergillus pseudoustus TaxID=1810923 RepID=A0ABR4KVY6_9EURO